MGLDVYIDKCRKPKIIEVDGRKYRDYEEREQLCYWRKNYDLLDIMKYGEDDYGQDVCMRKEDVEKILDYVAHNRDYFGVFDTVPDVCELLDQWNELAEDGWTICFNANW